MSISDLTPGALAHADGGAGPERRALKLGIMTLTDCAPLAVAGERGLFERHGLRVELSREASWANIRDKVAIGALDGAQMLAGMPIAASVGVGAINKPMIAALSLGLNGNAVTVSQALYARMLELDPAGTARPAQAAGVLKRLIDADRATGRPPPTFAVVYPVSTHNYLLRYWLAAAGIDPDRDVRIIVIPPPLMAQHLRAGDIDGCCVGEPWNSLAVEQGAGSMLAASHDIWNHHPEKVLAVTREWADAHPRTHAALLRALLEAAAWADAPENREELTALLVGGGYVSATRSAVAAALTGRVTMAPGGPPRALPDMLVFGRYAAGFPWRSHAVWLLTQMYRWGQLVAPVDIIATAAEIYRPDIYRTVAAELGLACPDRDSKTEGEHAGDWTLPGRGAALTLGSDRFCDGARFDPARPLAYLRQFALRNGRIDLEALAELNR